MLRPRELFQDTSVQFPAHVTLAREGQVWVGTNVPASREEAGASLGLCNKARLLLLAQSTKDSPSGLVVL